MLHINSSAEWNKQIFDFANSAEYRELAAYYSQPSIFSALGVSRQEDTHNNFIAWLLTPKPEKNDHGLGGLPLRKLLETLALVCKSLPHAAGKMPTNISNAVITGGYTLSNISVEREKHIGSGKLDVYIEGRLEIDGSAYPLKLVIENKIKSTEHDAQTERYQSYLTRAVPLSGVYLSIYLTPLNHQFTSFLR